METAPDSRPSVKVGDKIVYIIKSNDAFVRLLRLVVKEIKGYDSQVIPPDQAAGRILAEPPDILLIIEDSEAYRKLQALAPMADLPIVYVSISDLDMSNRPELRSLDRYWVLKNSPEDLLEVFNGLMPATRRKRILCVDDSPTVLSQITKAFAGTPYLVETAENGLEALQKLPDLQPDLILTDIEMPVMDGLELCRRVRAREGTAEAPLIILSSRVDYETIAQGFESGADEYLTKPFFPDELLNKVESYLVPPPTKREERVLVVNTNANVTHQLRLALDKQGFHVVTGRRPDEALAHAMADPPDLIVSDSELEGMTGYQLCSQIRSLPTMARTPFVVMTGKTSSGARKMGDKVGVSAYLTKPFTREGVIMLVERLLAEHRSLRALEWDMVLASITSLAKALDERDPYTRFHSENVARYAVAIGRKAGMNSLELENLRLAGQLHDIGKIGIPDGVLHKPGKLTADEFERIKQHSRLGAEILQPIPSLEEVLPGILHHHERPDGTGYPDGLQDTDIPLMAKILAVADTYDALVTDRPYRRGMEREEAVRIMQDASGTQLNPRLVKLFLEWLAAAE